MTTKETAPSRSIRVWLLLALLVLAGLTVYQQYRPKSAYTVTIRPNSLGWGYQIKAQDNVLIDQPTVPGQHGAVGFATEAQARRVGDYALHKLQDSHTLPTLTPDELRQLGVSIP